MPVIPVLGRLRPEDHHNLEANLGYMTEFKDYLHYTVRPFPRNQKTNHQKHIMKVWVVFDSVVWL